MDIPPTCWLRTPAISNCIILKLLGSVDRLNVFTEFRVMKSVFVTTEQEAPKKSTNKRIPAIRVDEIAIVHGIKPLRAPIGLPDSIIERLS
jgi:hypothetical protein